MLGPTLLDLGAQTDSSVREMVRAFISPPRQRIPPHQGFVFTIRSGLYLCGSLIGGEMVDRLSNPYFILSAAFLIVTVSASHAHHSHHVLTHAPASLLVQLCTTIYPLAALISMQGLCMGLLDTGGNVLVIRYWGEQCGPWSAPPSTAVRDINAHAGCKLCTFPLAWVPSPPHSLPSRSSSRSRAATSSARLTAVWRSSGPTTLSASLRSRWLLFSCTGACGRFRVRSPR